MAYLSDIEIAQQCEMKHIAEIAEKAGVLKYIEQYGNYKAKIDLSLLADAKDKKDGKLVLVTAMTPTPAGEGKTTTSIALADGMSIIGKKVRAVLQVAVTLRLCLWKTSIFTSQATSMLSQVQTIFLLL